MRPIKRTLVSLLVLSAVAGTMSSCDILSAFVGDSKIEVDFGGGSKSEAADLYNNAKYLYDEARATEQAYALTMEWVIDGNYEKSIHIANDVNKFVYRLSNSETGVEEEIIAVDDRAYCLDDSGKYCYYTPKSEVVREVEDKDIMNLFHTFYLCELSGGWFVEAPVAFKDPYQYVSVNVDEAKSLQHYRSDIFVAGSTCEVYYDEGRFSTVICSDVVVDGIKCDVIVGFEWFLESPICPPEDFKDYVEYDQNGNPVCDHKEESFQQTIKQPTCTEYGEIVNACQCGGLTNVEILEPLGHDEVEHEAKTPTCIEIGWREYVDCTRCDYTTFESLGYGDHSFVYGYCALCGESDAYSSCFYFVSNGDGTCYLAGFTEYHTLRDIIIPPVSPDGDVVTKIASMALNSSFIRSVRIPDTVKIIENVALSWANSLELVIIGSGVEEIGSTAFIGNEKLIEFRVDENNQHYKAVDGNLYTKDGKVLLQYAIAKKDISFDVPDSVEKIGELAFYKAVNLKNITLHDEITEIGKSAFYGCERLREIVIPEGITTIPAALFDCCTTLQNVTLPSTLKTIEINAFSSCVSLRELNIPDGVEFIDDWAFCSCTSITSLVIPDSVTSMGIGAFSGCCSLIDLVLPKNLEMIHMEAFMGCSSLTNLVIPEGVTTIGKDAFKRCQNLTTVVVPFSLRTIGNDAFWDCPNLSEIYYAGAREDYHIEGTFYMYEGVMYYYSATKPTVEGDFWHYVLDVPTLWTPYNRAEDYSTGLAYTSNGDRTCYVSGVGTCTDKVVIIPTNSPSGDLVTGIGASAFENCETAEKIFLPFTLLKIGERAFAGCQNLTDISFHKGVKTVGEEAFRNCINLRSITLPDSVETVGDFAFAGCTGLRNAYLGNQLHWIARHMFDGCELLYSVNIPHSVKYIGKYAFRNAYALNSIALGDGVETICEGAFENSGLWLVSLGKNVKTLESKAFAGCGGLDRINLPASLTEIADDAFMYCGKLRHIDVHEDNPNYREIGGHIYTKDGTTLVRVTDLTMADSYLDKHLYEGMTCIGAYAFSGAFELLTLFFTNALVVVEENAFLDVPNLQRIYFYGTQEEFEKISIAAGNEAFTNATVYFYSATKPTEDGNFWRYVSGFIYTWDEF